MKLSKAQSKYIRSLALQKFREMHGVYVVEGEKIIAEYLFAQHPMSLLLVTESFKKKYCSNITGNQIDKIVVVSEEELGWVSNLKVASQALAVVPLPQKKALPEHMGWSIALQDIRDPGNMGSILRIADWFGISQIIYSPECVDIFQPKVVQSAMGAHLRVSFWETDLELLLAKTSKPVYAAVLGGANLFQLKKVKEGIILIGNESKGLPTNLVQLCAHQISIPGKGGAESLNAAVATGIICAYLTAK